MQDQIKSMLVDAIRLSSARQERSLQTDVGPSELGGCRRRVWHRLQGTPESNKSTKVLASFMGNAIHDWIENALAGADPFGDMLHREFEVSHDGLTGHVDLYDSGRLLVVDWKTTTKKNLSYFPSKQQRMQVMVYGWLLNETGHPVETVSLVAIARDGNEDDIVVHVEDYDPELAQEALLWLADVKAMTEAPPPEKYEAFCRDYCPFFGACPGKTESVEGELLDADTADVVAEYVAVRNAKADATARLDALKEALESVVGVTESGTSVRWSERNNTTIDRALIEKTMGYVPTTSRGVSRVLSVKEAK